MEYGALLQSFSNLYQSDCHFIVGGALGTGLQVSECPKLSGGIRSQCVAASIMMLIAPTANGYFENVWLWVAGESLREFTLSKYSQRLDHDIDDAQNTQVCLTTMILCSAITLNTNSD